MHPLASSQALFAVT